MPGRRERGWLHAAVKYKPLAKNGLETLDTTSDRRLGQIEPKGGAVHRAGLRNRHEGSNILYVHKNYA